MVGVGAVLNGICQMATVYDVLIDGRHLMVGVGAVLNGICRHRIY